MSQEEYDMDPTTTPATRTITLTDRQPVTISDADWPSIASAAHDWHEGEFKHQANRHRSGWLRVRLHADGRAIVYGRDTYSTVWQGEDDHDLRAGVLLAAGADLPAEIRRVAESLIERGGWDGLHEIAQDCIADLPAERI